jgi:hypothetical protein
MLIFLDGNKPCVYFTRSVRDGNPSMAEVAKNRASRCALSAKNKRATLLFETLRERQAQGKKSRGLVTSGKPTYYAKTDKVDTTNWWIANAIARATVWRIIFPGATPQYSSGTINCIRNDRHLVILESDRE